MKSTPFLLLLLLTLTACVGGKKTTWQPRLASGSTPAVIPAPTQINWGEKQFLVPENNLICFNQGSETAAQWLQQLLVRNGINSETTSGESCGSWNLLKKEDILGQLGEEGYRLDINEKGVTLQSATDAGLYYGIQTLRQLLPVSGEQGQGTEEQILLRETIIQDVPHYSWRGTMVDVARSFFGLEYLKKHVDRMATFKLNRLHLHLTDDQGWRIEIKSWPRLTEVGSDNAVMDGQAGYLTQEEYKELQAYAAARHIVIVPEIDLPGHTYAALRSYPEELNCPGQSNIYPKEATPPHAYQGIKVGWSKLCLENPAIYDFVGDVLGELADITTGPWLHIGGDEIEDPRYEEFVVKADSIVRSNGKTSIGWEEVAKADIPSSMITQQWLGKTPPKADAKVILSLCSSFYLDHGNVPGQEHTYNWCDKQGVSIEDVYNFSFEYQNVLGVEAPVWTEFVISEARMDDRFWPRALAVAELGWSGPEDRDFGDFMDRLQELAPRLNAMGMDYFSTPGIDWHPEEQAPQPGNVFEGFMPRVENYEL